MNIYQRAERNGVTYECNCTDLTSHYKWEALMKGHKRADRKQVIKIARAVGIIAHPDDYTREMKNPYYNPYNHFKTDTHLIYVHSGIEYFIRVH
jgi:hypothetical protein